MWERARESEDGLRREDEKRQLGYMRLRVLEIRRKMAAERGGGEI